MPDNGYKRLSWTPTTELITENFQTMIESDEYLSSLAGAKYGYNFYMIQITETDDFGAADSITSDLDVRSPLVLAQAFDVTVQSTNDWWEFGAMIPNINVYGGPVADTGDPNVAGSSFTDDDAPTGKIVAVGLYEISEENDDVMLAKVRAAPLMIKEPALDSISPAGHTVCGQDIFQFSSTGRKDLYVVLSTSGILGEDGFGYAVKCSELRPIQFYLMNMGTVIDSDSGYDV